jgi:hypothetical protein
MLWYDSGTGRFMSEDPMGFAARVPRLDGLELIFVCHCLEQAVLALPGRQTSPVV